MSNGTGKRARELIERTLALEDIHWPIFFESMEEIVGEMSEEKKQALKVSLLELKVIRLEERVLQSEKKAAALEVLFRDLGGIGLIKIRD